MKFTKLRVFQAKEQRVQVCRREKVLEIPDTSGGLLVTVPRPREAVCQRLKPADGGSDCQVHSSSALGSYGPQVLPQALVSGGGNNAGHKGCAQYQFLLFVNEM